MVFGQAMIDAYYFECKNAKYPRIVFSDILLDQLNYPIESKSDKYPYHQYLDRFEDGAVGFNQMVYYELIQNWDEISEKQLAEKLDKIREVIINGLDRSFQNTEVFTKYLWLKNQYNKLIILEECDSKNISKEIIKLKIREPNDGIAGKNMHYSYTDDFYLKVKRGSIK